MSTNAYTTNGEGSLSADENSDVWGRRSNDNTGENDRDSGGYFEATAVCVLCVCVCVCTYVCENSHVSGRQINDNTGENDRAKVRRRLCVFSVLALGICTYEYWCVLYLHVSLRVCMTCNYVRIHTYIYDLFLRHEN
jgi:hypothetical protein